jgi:hypothetical protein
MIAGHDLPAVGGWEMIPFEIFRFDIAGSQSQAAALGVILIVLFAASLYIVQPHCRHQGGGIVWLNRANSHSPSGRNPA